MACCLLVILTVIIVGLLALEKRELLGDGHDGDVYLDMDGASREQVRQQTQQLLRQGDDHLQNALQDVTEMENIAVSVNSDLAAQREVIEGMRGRLEDINASVDRSEGLVRNRICYPSVRAQDVTRLCFVFRFVFLADAFHLSQYDVQQNCVWDWR